MITSNQSPSSTSVSEVGFVIVTRDRPSELRDCLVSINSRSPSCVDVAIIDNSDESITMSQIEDLSNTLERVRIIYRRIPASRSVLAQGRNLGASLISSTLIAFLDDDTLLSESWFSACKEIFSDTSIAAGTGVIVEPDTLDLDPYESKPIGKLLNNGVLTDNFYLRPKTPVLIDHVRGCNWVIKHEVFDQFLGFDPAFEHVYEEADLCLRLWRAGKKILFHPGLEVEHRCAPRTNILRKRDPNLRFIQREENIKFYVFLLLKNLSPFSLKVLRYFLTVDTGILFLFKEPGIESLRHFLAGMSGRLKGLARYIGMALISRRSPM